MPLPPRTDQEIKGLQALRKFRKAPPEEQRKMSLEPGFKQMLAIGFRRFVLEEQAEFSAGGN